VITAVDTNILLDVFGADAKFGKPSSTALRRCFADGALVACEVVWAETAAVFPDEPGLLEAMKTLGIGFSPITFQTALQAGVTWRKYRKAGGKRARVVADFRIGAHAASQCDRLLTRDRGFYGTYFSGLKVLDPSA
jgi:predicted nucleic acid-binding protein